MRDRLDRAYATNGARFQFVGLAMKAPGSGGAECSALSGSGRRTHPQGRGPFVNAAVTAPARRGQTGG
ncbi:hypothetical protein GCM10009779_11280 [Polymorphospora rubra]|uniref:Uncharacterized protein n=1 Tax=Polymorphospora rubra TaxID=338584 RepID=A0A810N6Q5_9ACTN|nr:hypothetical protein Prubr_61070 [Polymorphospora rubra]